MTNSVEIIYKNKNVVIINKPCGMPSQSDTSGDKDAMTATSELLASLGEPSSLWLVHRLDRTVCGLIAFARSKASAAALSELVAAGDLTKQYFAAAKGRVEGGVFRDILYKDARQGKSFVINTKRSGAKEAELICESRECIARQGREITLCAITLKTGRFHQIRCQLSSRGYALIGDKKYGGADSNSRFPALMSARLAFELDGENIDVSALPILTDYPWSLFSPQAYEFK
jgi:23S rRNA pseudouridine1911/1915/1917 synthase